MQSSEPNPYYPIFDPVSHLFPELDEHSVAKQKLDTSLDSGLQRKAKRGRQRKQYTSRLLNELKSELGPRFSFTEDGQNGNLRSKYGRLQKVHESSGYVPSDLFRPTKKSPIKSEMSIIKGSVVAQSTEEAMQLPVSEDQRVAINDSSKDSKPGNALANSGSEEAMDIEVATNDCYVVITEARPIVAVVVVDDADDHLDVEKERPAIPAISRFPVVIKQEPIEKEEAEVKKGNKSISSTPVIASVTASPLPPPPLPLVKGAEVRVPGIISGRRLSMRRMSILNAPATTPAPKVVSPLVVTKQSANLVPKIEPYQLQEVRRGVLISPDYEHHEKFTNLSHLTPGMLIWGACSKYPLWPCMVCADDKGLFFKQCEYPLVVFILLLMSYCVLTCKEYYHVRIMECGVKLQMPGNVIY